MYEIEWMCHLRGIEVIYTVSYIGMMQMKQPFSPINLIDQHTLVGRRKGDRFVTKKIFNLIYRSVLSETASPINGCWEQVFNQLSDDYYFCGEVPESGLSEQS